MEDSALVGAISVICITVLGVTYFIFIRQDGSVLLSLCSVIGGILGYIVGSRRGRVQEPRKK